MVAHGGAFIHLNKKARVYLLTPMRLTTSGSGQNIFSSIAAQLMTMDSFWVGQKQVHVRWSGGHSISPLPRGHVSPCVSALISP